MVTDYAALTETPGLSVTHEAHAMMHTRYSWAADHADGARVLEVGAGAGIGLEYLRQVADTIVAIDVDNSLVAEIRRTYEGHEVSPANGDGAALPFRDGVFDLVMLFEAIYYLPDVRAFFEEANRVLRPGGRLLICTANRDRAGFVESPRSESYFGPRELVTLFLDNGFDDVTLLGAFPLETTGLTDRLLNRAIQLADGIGLIPATLEGRARLKRIFFDGVLDLPRRLEPDESLTQNPRPADVNYQDEWKVIYVKGESKDRNE